MINKAIVQGRFVNDPELRTTGSGVSVTSFTIAVQGRNEKTDWIDCVAWRNTAEFICKYFKKGQQIIVVGSIQTSNFEDRDGNKRKKTELVIDEANFCGDKKQEKSSYVEVDYPDDLPFN